MLSFDKTHSRLLIYEQLSTLHFYSAQNVVQ
jgi:hypothetical protein